MSLLGAVTADFADQLKKRTVGWTVTPLVICEERIDPKYGFMHNHFLFVKKTPPNRSPLDFFMANPPLLKHAFILIKRPKVPLRAIGLELEARDTLRVHLTFWRSNGYVEHFSPRKRGHGRRMRYDGGEEGYEAMLMCQIHHVAPKSGKGHRKFLRHHYDINNPEPPNELLDLVVRIIDKSYHWHGMGKREVFGRYQFPVMVDLEGKNYHADEHHIR